MLDCKLKFIISLYDYENDLIERYEVYTEEEKDVALEKHYYNNEEALHCDVERIQTETTYLEK